jgi:hypothetical protein
LERYPVAVVRVQFTDRLVLQLPLPTQALVSHLMGEVSVYLEGSPNRPDFHLFTSPPKAFLEKKSSMLELGLTPKTVVYIGSNKGDNCTVKNQYRQNLSSYLGAMREEARRIAPSAKRPSTSAKSTKIPK